MHAVEEVSADFVHLVDEHDARNLVAVSLTPNGFGLRLNTGVGVQNSNRTVKNRQRTFNFDGEVNVAGGVDDVHAVLAESGVVPSSVRSQNVVVAADVIVMPRSCSCSIQSMVAAPSCTSPMLWDFACVIQDALGTGGLACIDMRHDAEVTVALEGIFACHWAAPEVFTSGSG